jgi:hypothetical protein
MSLSHQEKGDKDMSTTRVVTIVCWIVSALVLIGLVIWFITGSIFGVALGRWGNNMNFMINIGGSIERLTGPFQSRGTQAAAATGIERININWTAGEVMVIPHDGNEIIITEFAQRELEDFERLSISTDGRALTIRYTERTNIRRMPQKRLEVLVPHALSENMRMLSIDTVSSGVNVTDINASKLDCETVSGSIELSGVFANVSIDSVSGRVNLVNSAQNAVVDAETISGRVDVSGYFDRVEANTVSGSVSISSAQIPSSLRVDSISGGITIALPSDATISVNHSSVSGRLSSYNARRLGVVRRYIFSYNSMSPVTHCCDKV